MIGQGFKTRAHTPLPKLSPSHPEGLLPELDLSYLSRDYIQGSMRCHGQCVPSSAKPLCRLIVYIMGMWSMLAEKSSLRCTMARIYVS